MRKPDLLVHVDVFSGQEFDLAEEALLEESRRRKTWQLARRRKSRREFRGTNRRHDRHGGLANDLRAAAELLANMAALLMVLAL